MLSYPRIRALQRGHALGGDAIDSLSGTRWTTTLRNDPISKPTPPARMAVTLATAVHITQGGDGLQRRRRAQGIARRRGSLGEVDPGQPQSHVGETSVIFESVGRPICVNLTGPGERVLRDKLAWGVQHRSNGTVNGEGVFDREISLYRIVAGRRGGVCHVWRDEPEPALRGGG